MFDREAILPLLLGAVFAVLAHVGAAAAIVHWHPAESADEAIHPEREREQSAEAETRPDIAAAGIEVSEPRVAGQPATIRVRLSNTGGEDVAAFDYTLKVGEVVVHRGRVEEGLAAGAEVEREVEHTVDRGGTHRLTLTADTERETDDADRGNNRLSVTYFWDVAEADRPDGVDVAVSDLQVGRPRVVGAPVTVSGRAVNVGRSDSGVFNLTLRVDGEAVEQRTVDGLAGGGAAERLVTRIYVDEPGEHDVTLEVAGPGLREDLDESNNTMTRRVEWKSPDDLDKPVVGQRDPSPVKMNWISYEDYQELVARRAEFDQAALQRDVEPIEQGPTPQDPTDPAPPESQQQQSPPPAPQRPTPPEPSQQQAEAESMQQPSQPTPPEQISEEDLTAPALEELEAEMAAAPVEAEAGLPDPPEAAEVDASQTEQVTDLTESADPVDATPAEAAPAPEVAIVSPDVPAEPDADMLLPEASEREATVADRRAPEGPTDEAADPTDRSLQLRVEDLLERDEVTLPLKPEPQTEPGSPQQEETEAEATNRETALADRRIDPSRPVQDGAMAEQAEQPASPAEQERPQPQQNEPSRPTAAPRDERESPPVSQLSDAEVQPGEVIARQGIEIRTVEPRFSDIARRTALPRNPEIVVTFNEDGEVIHAQITRSTGYANVDGPVLASLYRWSAHGDLLEQVDDVFTMRVRILFGVEDEEDEGDEDEE